MFDTLKCECDKNQRTFRLETKVDYNGKIVQEITGYYRDYEHLNFTQQPKAQNGNTASGV